MPAGLRLIYGILVLNLAVVFVSGFGFYSPATTIGDFDYTSFTASFIGQISIASIVIAIGVGAIASLVSNINPLHAGGLAMVLTYLIPIWVDARNILTRIAQVADQELGVGHFVVAVNLFFVVCVIVLLVLIIQFATGSGIGGYE